MNLNVNLSGEPYLLTFFANLQFFLHKVAFEIHFEEKVRVRVRSAIIIKLGCAHVCVRTDFWTCEVRACDAKNGRNPCLAKNATRVKFLVKLNHSFTFRITPKKLTPPFTLFDQADLTT